MDDPKAMRRAGGRPHDHRAEDLLAEMFSHAGWKVRRQERHPPSPADLVVRKGRVSYAVEVKAASEGRSDRLIPLWSQAYLQAMHRAQADAARRRPSPLVVIAAPAIARRVADNVLAFAAEFAPQVAIGVIDFQGLRMFAGPHLEEMNSSNGRAEPRRRSNPAMRREPSNLFSDLNQWMLKVLLAPELPEALLAAPRRRYRNASELAEAANVSVMSAYRLVQQLQQDGYLHESAHYLDLVRRDDLFRDWCASAMRRAREVPMRFLLRGDPRVDLRRVVRGRGACLALFAAAEALRFGFVQGVPPYVYVRRLDSASISEWKNIVPAEQGESPDLIIRQAPAPASVFRGLVEVDNVPVCDILQVWLDVSSHPSRGQEQADLIRRRVLAPVIDGRQAHG